MKRLRAEKRPFRPDFKISWDFLETVRFLKLALYIVFSSDFTPTNIPFSALPINILFWRWAKNTM